MRPPTSTPKPRAEGRASASGALPRDDRSGAETKSFCPCQKSQVSASAAPDFFVSVRNVLATRHGCAPRGACRGALVAGGDRPAPTEPAGETSPSLHFRHVMEESPSLPLLYSSLSHPASSATNRCYPLQHPERTRFRLFWPKPGAFCSFCPLLTCKIFGSVFVHPAA